MGAIGSKSSSTFPASTSSTATFSSRTSQTLADTSSSSFVPQVNCQLLSGFASYSGYGFQNSTREPLTEQFLLHPGSTAYLNITYDLLSEPASQIANNASMYFGDLNFLFSIVNTSQIVSVPSAQVGLRIVPINVTALGNNSLAAVYVISATTTSPNASYFLPFWSTCPGPLLTIGDSFYSGPYATYNGTYY